ncbi:putative sterol carrier protein [Pseudomonas sp. PvR086]|uniref:cupin-like domain-containing protein n=1 Tax=Pseudomonas TaxID=286 RepID=UPI000369CF0C|nr:MULTISPECIES: cupin-like domain-containing protein [Pseudomonas]ANI61423.1 cupin [Pseudomonas sp. GR 6-02]MBD9608233.1 cupin-like domain-containing protein [Pseudomonas sp. PDM08]MDR7105708.1 putative sterol carrier protein [Pseudomonas frederiksbergensis]PMY55510.1 cupin [Pseudomonas sp. FW305-53]PMY86384.1 cupin [Pseudomonas sp. FW303-C2]
MDLQTILGKLFANAGAVGIEGVFQFVFGPHQAYWSEVKASSRTEAGRHASPDVTIEVAEQDFLGIMGGMANVEELFASGRLKIGGNMGLATMLPQIIDHARHGGGVVEKVDMNKRYPTPPRFSEKVSASLSPQRSVERRPRRELSVLEFETRYLPHGIPLVISDALQDWPLFKLSREESLVHFAELQGITRHGDYVKKTFSTERDFRSTSMAEFIASLDTPAVKSADGEPPAYMGNNILPAQLMEQIKYPPYFDQALFIPPRIWIGPKGTLTPLHRDDTDNLFAQVWGQKTFTLAAPHHREALGTWSTAPQGGLDGCDFNPDAPDYQRFPGAQDVTFLRVTLEAGDLLFLPEGWFHQVESVSTSLSVNFWVNSGRGW